MIALYGALFVQLNVVQVLRADGYNHNPANIRAVTQAWRWTAEDRLLLALPLFHTHGLMVGLHGTLYTGASVDLRRRFVASEVLEALREDPALTMFFGVPTMYSRLLEESRRTGVRPRPLRLMVSGSAPLSPQLFQEIDQSRGRLETMFQSIPVGLAVVNADFSDIRLNPSGAALLELPPEVNFIT